MNCVERHECGRIGILTQMRLNFPEMPAGKGFSEALTLSRALAPVVLFSYSVKDRVESVAVSRRLICYSVPLLLCPSLPRSACRYVLAVVRMVGVMLHASFKYGLSVVRAENALLGGVPSLVIRTLTGTPYGIWLGGIEENAAGYIFSRSKAKRILRLGIGMVKRLVMSLSDFVLCVSRETELNAAHHLARVTIRTPNFVDAAKYRRARQTTESVRVITYLGRLEPEKGIAVLLRALRVLKPRCRWEAWIVGDGSLADLVRHSTGGNTRHFGRIPHTQVPDILSRTDILVLPSLTEGAPASLLEAMAAGCAVVASSVGGIPEIVHHGTDGLLVEPGSPDALASALTYLIDYPEMVKRMGIAGQEYTRDLGKKYLSILFHVLGRYIGTG